MLRSEAVGVESGAVRLRDGRAVEADAFVSAVGVVPSGVFRRSGLLTAGDGGLWVNRYLQSPTDPGIFGGGDSVAFRGEPLRRLGVFAIRQGPVIHHNLRAFLEGGPLKAYRPQSAYLYILNLGDREGLAIWGPLVARGRMAWKLKNRIDRRFIDEYRYPQGEP